VLPPVLIDCLFDSYNLINRSGTFYFLHNYKDFISAILLAFTAMLVLTTSVSGQSILEDRPTVIAGGGTVLASWPSTPFDWDDVYMMEPPVYPRNVFTIHTFPNDYLQKILAYEHARWTV
jgi:hypothetical protein